MVRKPGECGRGDVKGLAGEEGEQYYVSAAAIHQTLLIVCLASRSPSDATSIPNGRSAAAVRPATLRQSTSDGWSAANVCSSELCSAGSADVWSYVSSASNDVWSADVCYAGSADSSARSADDVPAMRAGATTSGCSKKESSDDWTRTAFQDAEETHRRLDRGYRASARQLHAGPP